MRWRVFRRSSRARIIAASLALLVVAEIAVLVLLPGQSGPQPLAVEATDYFTPAQIERATDYQSGQRLISLALLVAEFALLALLASGRPAPARRFLERLESRPLLGALAAGAALSAALALLLLPLGLFAHERAVDVGLSTQDLASWLWDRGRGIGIGALYAAVGALILLVLQRRLPRSWWLAGTGVVIVYAVVSTFLAPVLLSPIFNDFQRLPAGQTRDDVVELADRAGVEIGDVYVVDASRRGTSLNAYVNGIGSTRRVVLYDNLVDAAERPALRSVVAHELGHVKGDDLVRGLVFVALVAPIGMLFVREVGGAVAVRTGTEAGRASALPAYALAIGIATLVLGVFGNQLSRGVEERADRFSIELTGDPAGLIELQRTIGIRNLSDPSPPEWTQLLWGTHPDKLERIGLAEAWPGGGPG